MQSRPDLQLTAAAPWEMPSLAQAAADGVTCIRHIWWHLYNVTTSHLSCGLSAGCACTTCSCPCMQQAWSALQNQCEQNDQATACSAQYQKSAASSSASRESRPATELEGVFSGDVGPLGGGPSPCQACKIIVNVSIHQSSKCTFPAYCWVCTWSFWILSLQKSLSWAFQGQLAVRPKAARSSRTVFAVVHVDHHHTMPGRGTDLARLRMPEAEVWSRHHQNLSQRFT